MMAVPAASASVTSDSLMAPTPAWMTRAATSSVPSLSSAPTTASTEPWTSPLMTSGIHVLSGVADERPDAPPFGAGDHDVARPQGAALDQHGRNGAAAAVELRLDDGAFRGAVRIGLELEKFRLQADGFQQAIEIEVLVGREFGV